VQDNIREKLAVLPAQPGCYIMKDKHGTVIYVGKSKVLKNRVRSYFTGANDAKTQRLVQEIVDFEYIVTSSEMEALILEMNLIKKYDPKYNVLLKDDKSYPYLKITGEKHPRLIVTRKVKKDKGKYFGPYPNVIAARETKRLLDRLYPLRKCNTMPDRVCLYYHMHQCLGPCEYKVTDEQNRDIVNEITRFLNGGHKEIKQDLKDKMQKASEELEFERAKELRDQIQHIESVMEQQKMTLNDQVNRDIFGYAYDKGWMCVQVFFIRQGKLIERDVSIFPFFDDAEETFLSFIGRFYLHQNHPKPKQVLVPVGADKDMLKELLELDVHIPMRGRKKELVELAMKNAQIALEEYKIREVEGPDDYETMREVIRRRYKRVVKDGLPLPDLIFVDGGKGQMSAAMDVLENELGLDIPLCGLAKDEKHRTSELLYGDPPQIVEMDRQSQEFYLIQRVQDEVHRFAISFHRQLRGKGVIQSELDQIPGVGEKRRRLLLRHFHSVQKIRESTVEDITKLGIPANVANEMLNHLREKEAEKELEQEEE